MKSWKTNSRKLDINVWNHLRFENKKNIYEIKIKKELFFTKLLKTGTSAQWEGNSSEKMPNKWPKD